MRDGELDLTLFNGVRNSETNISLNSCAAKQNLSLSARARWGIPGLAIWSGRMKLLRVCLNNPSIWNQNAEPDTQLNGFVCIPHLYKRVYKLSSIVDVDYFVPGCQPAPHQVKAVLLAIAKGDLPPKGSVVGASELTVCDDCKRKKTEKKIKRFYRPFEIIQDPEKCLLEQGIPVWVSGYAFRMRSSLPG
jgi:F420-non-reducing hydrogenase small subunit